jgi:NADH:ubiquinone oxidoreductase subunit E
MANSLKAILEPRRSQPQELIEVLQDIQEAFGYISEQSMETVARELGVPLIEVSRVAHFYKAFSLQPRGKHMLTFCMGTACHVRGANPLLEQASALLGVEPGGTTEDGMFTLESVNCLGACALGPVAVLDGVYCHHMTPAKLKELIDSVREAERERRKGVPPADTTRRARPAAG